MSRQGISNITKKFTNFRIQNTKDILVVFIYTFLIGWMKHSKSLGRDLTPNQNHLPW